MKTRVNYTLYLVTDRGLAGARAMEEIVEKSVLGGATVVQLREKHACTRDFVQNALALKRVLSPFGVPLIINDRIDVALACGAEGVHLGQEDMECGLARRILGQNTIIGVSVSSPREALLAEAAGADYLGAGPVFATATKTDGHQPTGFEGLAQIRRATRLPLVAIGGINDSNAAETIRHGADGLAVVSALVCSPDPEASARKLCAVIANARKD